MDTKSESLLPYYTAQSGSGVGMFNTAMGKLQRQLHKGEYDIFKYAPIFESDFIQITKRGEVIDVHNRVRMVTVGIACTSPILPLPDVMLLARPAPCEELSGGRGLSSNKGKKRKTLELTRLLPLKFVKISIHKRDKQQLRLKFATGRSCYLQLCPPPDSKDDLFYYWEKLIYLLRPPVESTSSTYAIPAGDMVSMPLLDDEHKTTHHKADAKRKKEPDQVSVKSLSLAANLSEVSSSAFAGGEGTHHDSHIATVVSRVPTPKMSTKVLAIESVRGSIVSDLVGTLSLPANRSIGSGQINTATAGEAVMGARGSKSYLTIASAGKMSPKSMKMALSGVGSKSLEYIPNASSNLARKEIMTITNSRIETTEKSAGVTVNEPVILALTVPTGSHSSEETGPRKAYAATAKARKERRSRRDQRAKERVSSRSERHHRTGESRKTAGDKEFRKSASHRGISSDKKDKGGKRSRSHKGVSHVPITKESRSSHKLGRTLSTASSVSTNKRMGRISLFLRNIRANLASKGLASQRGQDVDIITKTLEKTDVKAVMETEDGQGLEIVDSVTSEVMETVTFEAH